MKIEDLVVRVSPVLTNLAAQLEAIAVKYPDTEPVLRPKIDALRASADPAGLANLAAAAVAEIKALLQTGEIKPKAHPSDLAG